MTVDAPERPRFAIALCIHHKPWLAMSSLISLLGQSRQDFDLHLIFIEGDGYCRGKASYREYHALADESAARGLIAASPEIERRREQNYNQLARTAGINGKLSPFDERLKEICRLDRRRTFYHSYENDHALDSGAWLKFIRDGPWRDYDYVAMIQEGTLLTSPETFADLSTGMRRLGVEFLAGAHMKSCQPRSTILSYNSRAFADPLPIDRLHDRMILEIVEAFKADPDFSAVFEEWGAWDGMSRQFHMRDLRQGLLARIHDALTRPTGSPFRKWLTKAFSAPFGAPDVIEQKAAAWLVRLGKGTTLVRDPETERIFVDGARLRLADVIDAVQVDNTLFHRESSVAWYGCGCNHVLSREFIDRLDRHLREYHLYERALETPFAGTVLEVIWGLMPRWLGSEKWFFDGFHRVTKNPATREREDTPVGIVRYLNRYYEGSIAVRNEDDLVKVRALAPGAGFVKSGLNDWFF